MVKVVSFDATANDKDIFTKLKEEPVSNSEKITKVLKQT